MKTMLNGHPRKIRTLILAPFFSHVATATRPLLVSDVLARFGTVDIVTTNFDHQTKAAKNEFQFGDKRTIYYLPTMAYRHNISPARFLSHFAFSLRAWIFYLKRKGEYDVVYSTLPLNLIALLLFISGNGKLRIADVVDIWPDVLPFPSIAKKLFSPLFFIWKKSFQYAIKNCDVLLTVSDRFLNEAINYFSREESAAQRFYIGDKKIPPKPKDDDGRLTVVYIGNIGHLYDFQTLLGALTACSGKPRFFLIGDGDRKEWLLDELKRLHVEYQYFGIVYDNERLSDILSHCDIGFNGYLNTTAAFSYKANTYFAAGLPILNSMRSDMERLVAEHGLGFNYIPGDIASLRACISGCSPEILSSLSRNVNQFFESEIDQDIIKNKLAAFISRFLIDTGH